MIFARSPRYRAAAERGEARAQNNLGNMYIKGLGVPQDYVLAHKWFNLAGASGNENGVRNRDRLAREMTDLQLAEAQRLARVWHDMNSGAHMPRTKETPLQAAAGVPVADTDDTGAGQSRFGRWLGFGK